MCLRASCANVAAYFESLRDRESGIEPESGTETASVVSDERSDERYDSQIHAAAKYDHIQRMLRLQRRPTLIFTHFDDAVTVLRTKLHTDGHVVDAITGSMSRAARSKAVARFYASHDGVLVLSLRTAGVGLNLTHARRVFFLEPSLNRALERQAVGRVHRVGLTHDVDVYYLVALDTVEERVRAFENIQDSQNTEDTEEAPNDESSVHVHSTVVVRTESQRTAWRLTQLQSLIGSPR